MFEFLRKLIVPLMLFVLIAFVASIIFSWGQGGFQGPSRDTVGVVNGNEISFREFERYYSLLYRQEQQNNDYEVSDDKAKQLRQQAWSQVVADKLFDAELARADIFVTTKEVFDFITYYPPQDLQAAPQFQTDGQFDYQKYINAMPVPENAPFWAQVEAMVTPDLMKRKLVQDIYASVRVTPSEVLEKFMGEQEKIRVGYINVMADQMSKMAPEPTDQEMRDYYEANKEDFKLGSRAALDIVKFEKVPSDQDWEIIKNDMIDIHDSLKQGADFAGLAEVFSDDGSAENGGDLGWFAKGRMVKAFDSAVFAMQVDEISPPIKTQFGWHIIKLNGIRTDREIPPGQSVESDVEKRNAAHILMRVVPSQETLDRIYNNSTSLAEAARLTSLSEAAKEYNYTVTNSSKFFENSYINQDLQRNEEASKFAFANEVGAIADPIETTNGVFVITVTERLSEGYSDFEDVKSGITNILKKEQGQKMALDTMQVMYDAVMGGLAPSEIQNQFGFEYNRSDYFTRGQSVPMIGSDPRFIGAAFALTEVNQFSNPFEFSKGAALVTLLDRQSPNLTQYSEVQDSLYMAVMLEKQQDVYNRWFDQLVEKAEIENLLDQFYTSTP